LWYLYTKEFYSVTNKYEILLFAGKWMELENVIISEVSKAQKSRSHMCSLICGAQTQNNAAILWKIDHAKGGVTLERRWLKEGSYEGEYGGCALYTRMNVESLNLLKPL
jgi:hypothetical protein